MTDSAEKQPSGSEQPEENVRRYIEELRKNPSRETMISGMVKPAENNDGLMFAHIGDCEHWTFISAAAIQAIKSMGRVQCGGHSHALAEIQLKAPQSLTRNRENCDFLMR
jgi:hypothetical protein